MKTISPPVPAVALPQELVFALGTAPPAPLEEGLVTSPSCSSTQQEPRGVVPWLVMSCSLLLFASTIQSMHKNEASGEGNEPRELVALNAANISSKIPPVSPSSVFYTITCLRSDTQHTSQAPRLVSGGSSHPRDLEGCLRTGHEGQNRPTLLRRQLTLLAAIYR